MSTSIKMQAILPIWIAGECRCFNVGTVIKRRQIWGHTVVEEPVVGSTCESD